MAEFTVATWNVENLFRPSADADDAEHQRYADKLAYLARIIKQMNPDIIALQEVGGSAALEDLQAACDAEVFDHKTIGRADARGIAVGFLSKYSFEATKRIDSLAPPVRELQIRDMQSAVVSELGRGAVHVRIVKAGFRVNLVTLHLKSKLLTYASNGNAPRFFPIHETERTLSATTALTKRAAEAATLRSYANGLIEENEGRSLVVLGDFNDGMEAATTQIFQGPDGSEIGTRGFSKPDKGDDARLWNLSACVPLERRFSRIHNGQGEMIDHIFCSKEFFPVSEDQTRRLPLVNVLTENIRPIGDEPSTESRDLHPDHAPVFATFNLG